jgi:hypothetical protein
MGAYILRPEQAASVLACSVPDEALQDERG